MAQDKSSEILTFRLGGELAKLEASPQVVFRVLQALKQSPHEIQILDQGNFRAVPKAA